MIGTTNFILNGVTTRMSSLNVQGSIIGSGTALSCNLNYNAITNKPDLTEFAENTNIDSLSTKFNFKYK